MLFNAYRKQLSLMAPWTEKNEAMKKGDYVKHYQLCTAVSVICIYIDIHTKRRNKE